MAAARPLNEYAVEPDGTPASRGFIDAFPGLGDAMEASR